MSILIYGATGYTGKLVVEQAVLKGLKPIVAGRSESKVKSLAATYDLEYKVFSLDNVPKIVDAISGVKVLLNCAGPFIHTAKHLIEACLLTQTHYLDITGEIEVFEMAKEFDLQAKDNEIIVLPGVGFDVVPTDCMANFLKEKLPEATHLELAFMGLGGAMSHGTMATMVESLGKGGAVRKDGKIENVPVGHEGKEIHFGMKKNWAMTIPWGDISTAYTSTGIDNIEVYTAVSKTTYNLLKAQLLINPILQNSWVKGMIKEYVDENFSGPTPEQNKKGIALVYGKATNHRMEDTVELRFKTPETYLLTAKLAVLISQKVLELKETYGYFTPAQLFGPKLIFEIEGVEWLDQ
ncbi:saccharopine dehydrogenase NADP-binding domain-containing protein [Litoribacter ruber]|uniref:saccharopine dehydrogenase family protein n=1 Tax=Litoribacter ruber TaxID=702568 RepID=UPI001BDB65E2|nr:saccharopine dehydrogenase NADP-binding domain-containing protein [Litoribacter ruber]MBT0811718.1 saccharopine dehydrogenase NADP-binding domain-containing protein [Litoribacter ruber]